MPTRKPNSNIGFDEPITPAAPETNRARPGRIDPIHRTYAPIRLPIRRVDHFDPNLNKPNPGPDFEFGKRGTIAGFNPRHLHLPL